MKKWTELQHIIHQRGMALVTSLIFLVLLTLVGVTAMQNTTLEEKMAGNNRDRNVAFQSAEAALRDAEFDIVCKKSESSGECTRSVKIADGSDFAMSISGATMFDATCTNGLCYFYPVKKDADWDTFWGDDLLGLAKMEKPSVEYGQYTAASKLSDVVKQPRYIIEAVKRWPAGSTGWMYYYRITARALGANANTQVILQSFFLP